MLLQILKKDLLKPLSPSSISAILVGLVMVFSIGFDFYSYSKVYQQNDPVLAATVFYAASNQTAPIQTNSTPWGDNRVSLSIPSCVASPSVRVVSPSESSNLESIINNSSQTVFCLESGSYASAGINITRTGSSSNPIWIRSVSDTHPANLADNQQAKFTGDVNLNTGAKFIRFHNIAFSPARVVIDGGEDIVFNQIRAKEVVDPARDWSQFLAWKGKNIVVQNSLLGDVTPRANKDTMGFMMTKAVSNVIFSHNEIRNATDSFQFDYGAEYNLTANPGKVVIEYNDMYITNALYTNGGGQFSTSGDFAAAENAIDIKDSEGGVSSVTKDSQDFTLLIQGNTMRGFRRTDASAGGTGSQGETIIMHEDGPIDVLVRGNIVEDSRWGFVVYNPSKYVSIHNNILANMGTGTGNDHGFLLLGSQKVELYHNTVTSTNGRLTNYIYADNTVNQLDARGNLFVDAGQFRLSGTPPQNSNIQNNAFVGSSQAYILPTSASNNNSVLTLANAKLGQLCYTVQPFTSPTTRCIQNVLPQATSPLIDAGSSQIGSLSDIGYSDQVGISTDVTGFTRSGNPDLGAFESRSSSSTTAPVINTTAPASPINLAGSYSSSTGNVSLSWQAVSGVNGYKVYRSNSGGSLSLIGESLTNSYSDTVSQNSTAQNFTYAVKSFNSSLESGFSTSVQVIVPALTTTNNNSTTTTTTTNTITTTSTTSTNVLLGKTVTYSGQENSTNGAANLVNGDDVDRWSVLNYPAWARIDLGSNFSVNKFELVPHQNRAYKYKVEGSLDGTNYFTVVDRSSNTQTGALFENSFSPVTLRYLRLTVTGASGYTGSWVSVKEIRAFGVPTSNTSSSTLLPPSNIISSLVNQTLTLSWPAVSGAQEYRVFSSATKGGPYTWVSGSSATSYTELFTSGTKYYVVVSVNGTNQSPYSNEVVVSAPVVSKPSITLKISPFGSTTSSDFNLTQINLSSFTAQNITFSSVSSSSAAVGSVRYQLSGKQTKNQIVSGSPYNFVFSPQTGSYTLTVTPYSGQNGTGTAGDPKVFNFTVVDTDAESILTSIRNFLSKRSSVADKTYLKGLIDALFVN